MAGHEWFTLHFKSDNHVSENCVQGPAVHVGQMPNRLLLAASQSCPVLHTFDMAALSEKQIFLEMLLINCFELYCSGLFNSLKILGTRAVITVPLIFI